MSDAAKHNLPNLTDHRNGKQNSIPSAGIASTLQINAAPVCFKIKSTNDSCMKHIFKCANGFEPNS